MLLVVQNGSARDQPYDEEDQRGDGYERREYRPHLPAPQRIALVATRDQIKQQVPHARQYRFPCEVRVLRRLTRSSPVFA